MEASLPELGLELPVAANRTDDGVVRFRVPPGLGTEHLVSIQVGRTFTDLQATSPVRIRYARPRVRQVQPQPVGTAGGDVVTLSGRDFGADSSLAQAVVTIGGRPCELVPASLSALHDEVRCITPVHSGRTLPIEMVVAGQTSQSKERGVQQPDVSVTYRRPSVQSAYPLGGPTSGSTPDGEPYIMHLRGSDFGDGNQGQVELRPSVLRGASALTADEYATALFQQVNVTHDSPLVQSWNHTDIVVHMPEGAGENLDVHVLVSGQRSDRNPDLVFTYDPPVVYGWRRTRDRSAEECMPRQRCKTFEGQDYCRVVPSGCYPTKGEFAIEIDGESFGRSGADVTLGSYVCQVVSAFDDPLNA